MMRQFLVMCVITFIFSCKGNKSEFSDIPEIKFKSGILVTEKDELNNTYKVYKVSLSFTDGDGNMGLEKKDLEKEDFKEKYKNNLWVEMYKNINGTLLLQDTKEQYNKVIPFIKGNSVNKEQVGTIDFVLELRTLKDNATVQFQFQIVDKNKNKSNIVKSPIVILKK